MNQWQLKQQSSRTADNGSSLGKDRDRNESGWGAACRRQDSDKKNYNLGEIKKVSDNSGWVICHQMVYRSCSEVKHQVPSQINPNFNSISHFYWTFYVSSSIFHFKYHRSYFKFHHWHTSPKKTRKIRDTFHNFFIHFHNVKSIGRITYF